MASVTIQKWSTAAACGGQISHIYRTREHYGNKDIDLSQADRNGYSGTAEAARTRIRGVIAKVDAMTPPKRIRADRKTVAELCIPAPRAGMDEQEARRFLARVFTELRHMPDIHLVAGAIHGDEVHEYVDPDSKMRVQSRLHLHVLVVPDVPGRGCNMKAWLTKSRYREINQALDRVCERELGYSYQDGTKSRSRGDVERVKIASQRAEAEELAARIDIMRQETARLDKIRQESQQRAARAAQEADKAKSRAQAAELAQKQAEEAQRLSEAQTEAAERRLMQIQEREDELREKVGDLDIARALLAAPENQTLSDAKATARKSLVGDNIVIPRREFESICALAESSYANHVAAHQMEQEKWDAEREAYWAEERAEKRARNISLDEARERVERDTRLKRYEQMEEAYPDVFKEMDSRLSRTMEHERTR